MKNSSPVGGVVFVIDRVMHYHAATMRAIEQGLSMRGIPFAVLSAQDSNNTVGRVAMRSKAVTNHRYFQLTERRIGRFMFRFQQGLTLHCEEVKPLVVISTCHSGTLSEWLLLWWAKRRGVRRVAWQCGYEYNPTLIKSTVLRLFIPLFDFHLCYHSNARKYALAYGATPAQTLVMHNTIDESSIVAGDRPGAKDLLAARWPALAGKKIVLYVGAVLEEKHLDLVFSALDLMADDAVRFLLVGDGPYLPVLRERFKNRDDWIATGSIIQGVGEYFDAADVFVLPGTGGLAINEAMAHRLPVVSGYADGSADDLVIDGVTGYRLRSGSAGELADRLQDVLADPLRANTMGQQGEVRIRGDLSFQSFIERVVSLLADQHAQACKKT